MELPFRLVPLGFQQFTGSTTGTAQGLTVPAGASIAYMTGEVQAIRYRDDGTSPTTGVGILIPVTQLPFIYAGPLANFQFIGAVGGAVLNIAYYKAAGF
jgi:hypothetical protein